LVASYGECGLYYSVISNKNDLYLFKRSEGDTVISYQIYNIFEDELICCFDFENQRAYRPFTDGHFIYLLNWHNLENALFFEIYTIDNQQIELKNSIPVDETFIFGGYTVHDDKVYLEASEYLYTDVYEILETDLVYLGRFSGGIQNNIISDNLDDYIINIQSNQIILRDFNDFNNILATFTLPNWSFVASVYVNDEIFMLYNQYSHTYRAFHYDISEPYINQVFEFPEWPRIRATNGII